MKTKTFKKKITFLFLGILSLSIVIELVIFFIQTNKSGIYFKSSTTDRCKNESLIRKQRCWQNEIENTVRKDGVDKAFDLLALIYDSNPSFKQSCHLITHKIGEDSYILFHQKKDFKISVKAAYCSYGFYHGFMEALLTSKSNIKEAESFCNYVDKQMKELTPDASLQCFHGIGHGAVNSHELQTVTSEAVLVDPALELCKKVASDTSQLSRCATGVFNGLAIFYTTGEYGLKINQKDPLKVCRHQKSQFKDACYISMNTLLLQITNHDFVSAAMFIEQIPEDDYAQHAIKNLAAPIAVQNYDKTDHTATIEECRSLQRRLRSSCIQGYAYGFLEHGNPQNEYVKPLDFCSNELLSEEEASSCFKEIFYAIKLWYSNSKVEYICNSIKVKYGRECIQ